MKLLSIFIGIFLNVAFSQESVWNRVYSEITGKVKEIKYLTDIDPYSAIFALDADGIGYYKDSVLHKYSYDSLPVVSVEFTDSLSDKILCVMGNGSENDGLYIFNKGSETFSLLLSSKSPNFVRRLDDGKYYLGSKDGLFYSEDLSSWHSIDSLRGKNIFDASYAYYLNTLYATDGDKLYIFENETLNIVDPDLSISDFYGDYFLLKGGSYSDGIYYLHGNELELYCYASNPDILGRYFGVGFLVICQSEDRIFYIDSSHAPALSDIPTCPFYYNSIYSTETYPISEYYIQNFIICTDTGIYKYEGTVGIEENDNRIKNFEISQNYPNPFNNETTITLNLVKSSYIELNVFNTKGELVDSIVSSKLNKGNHNFTFKADNLNSGMYFYKLDIDGIAKVTKKMLYLR